jgi:hypothetical protein
MKLVKYFLLFTFLVTLLEARGDVYENYPDEEIYPVEGYEVMDPEQEFAHQHVLGETEAQEDFIYPEGEPAIWEEEGEPTPEAYE